MPEFRYAVVDKNGQMLTGSLEAENEDICRRIITQRGLYCLSVTPASFASRSLSFGGKSKIKPKELAVFCRQFSTMLTAGIGVIKSLDILHTQAGKPRIKGILKSVYDAVQRGQSFSSALKAQGTTFPLLLISMVEAGEASGTLDKVMERVADHYEKDIKTSNKIKGAMMYPLILSILMVLVVIVMMVFVLPKFMGMFASAGASLPLPTRILLGISNSLTHYWYLYLIVISAAALIWINYLKSQGGRITWDRFKTRAPVLGKLMVTIISARFARTLSTLMRSGIPMLPCLEITSRVLGNRYFEEKMTELREEIRRGTSLSSAMKKIDIFPMMMLSMISIGEESGSLDDVLQKTAAFYDEESDSAVSRMVGLLEPLMIVVMALVVGFIVISIVMPMYGMMTLVQ